MNTPSGGSNPFDKVQNQIKSISTLLWIGGLGTAAFLIADKVLPLIARVLQSGIQVGLLLIPAAILLIILTSPRFWFFLHYFIRSIGTWIVGIWQDTDPIGILKTCLADMKQRAERIAKAVLTVRGVMRDLKETMEANDRRIAEQTGLAKQAQKQQLPYQFKARANAAGRLQKSNMSYKQLYQKLEVLLRVLTRMHEAAEFVVEDKTDEVRELERRKKAVNAAYGAMQDAWAIIKGGKVREFFDSTVERLVTSLNQQLGEIDGFTEIAEGFMGSIDLQQGLYDDQMLQRLLEWEQKVDSAVLGDEKQQLLADATLATEAQFGTSGNTTGRYTQLLGDDAQSK